MGTFYVISSMYVALQEKCRVLHFNNIVSIVSCISFLIWKKMSFISSYHFMDCCVNGDWYYVHWTNVQGIMAPTTVEIFRYLKTCGECSIFVILNYSLKYFWYFIIWGKSHCTYSSVLCIFSGGKEVIKTQNYRETE